MPVTSAQCIIGTERYPDSASSLNYNDDDYSRGYGQIEEDFGALTKHYILHPYISEDDYRLCDDGDDIGYTIHAFDIRYQKNFENSQPVKVELHFSENIPARINGYAFILNNRLVTISSDGQPMFDLT